MPYSVELRPFPVPHPLRPEVGIVLYLAIGLAGGRAGVYLTRQDGPSLLSRLSTPQQDSVRRGSPGA